MNKRKPEEDYVWGVLSGYRYHKLQIREIKEKLEDIKSKLEAGGVSGIRSNGAFSSSAATPWIIELLADECELIKKLKGHERAAEQVDSWVSSIKNDDHHRDIFIDYVLYSIDASAVAECYDTTDSNVRVIARRSVQRISKKIKV